MELESFSHSILILEKLSSAHYADEEDIAIRRNVDGNSDDQPAALTKKMNTTTKSMLKHIR